MTKEESKESYEGKFFYEITDGEYIVGRPSKILYGPLYNIRYVNKEITHPYSKYDFVQILNGNIVATFTKQEILVTDTKL